VMLKSIFHILIFFEYNCFNISMSNMICIFSFFHIIFFFIIIIFIFFFCHWIRIMSIIPFCTSSFFDCGFIVFVKKISCISNPNSFYIFFFFSITKMVIIHFFILFRIIMIVIFFYYCFFFILIVFFSFVTNMIYGT